MCICIFYCNSVMKQSVSEMVEQTSGLSSLYQNKKKLYISICLELLNLSSQQHVDLSPSVFFFWSVLSLKNPNSK